MAAHAGWTLGYGGIAIVSRVTELSIPTIRTGLAELEDPDTVVIGFAGPERAVRTFARRTRITRPEMCPRRQSGSGGRKSQPLWSL